MPNFIVIFLTGLLTGGITCTAVQGGLLTGLVLSTKKDNQLPKKNYYVIGAFVLSKLISHLLFGMLLGLIGSTLQFSIQFTAIMLAISSFIMFGMAGNMLAIHPFFRRFAISTPKFIRRIIWKESKGGDFFAPVILGALTVFIPCGVTQAMMIQSMGYGNPLISGLLLFTFILGTTPLFLVFGLTVSKLSDRFTTGFQKAAALLVVGMAMWNLYNVSTIFGIDTKIQALGSGLYCQIQYCDSNVKTSHVATNITPTKTPIITIRQSSYEVDNQYLKAGDEVTLTVSNKDGYGCIQFFTIPSLGIQKPVAVGKTETFTFTVPQKKGDLLFTCSMGMYRGTFTIL